MLVAGADEVGRGPLAGPVVAAAVLLPPGCLIEGVDDSKKLSERKREQLYERIREKAVAYGVGWVGPERIDEINILQATREAFGLAYEAMEVKPDILLVDAVKGLAIPVRQEAARRRRGRPVLCTIGAASILARWSKDRYMRLDGRPCIPAMVSKPIRATGQRRIWQPSGPAGDLALCTGAALSARSGRIGNGDL